MEKTRIHPGNVEVKWGLGWNSTLRKPITLHHVIVNGHTLASFTTPEAAWNWIYEKYELVTHG
jgi:hypothetical protein